ncbi:MAG TPA: NAD-dependent epimerase/dehydratase family protein [Acidimicrobiales bacterium]|nr:NAD-dependent epimerase/dehydratase family protein [Acidimicrobiales bacterium]
MKILIIGGTSFVGRSIAWSAWHCGHEVSVFNRGVTPSDLPESVTRLIGDRQSDLHALAGHSFDATIDVTAYRPSDVERLADTLESRGGHYVQISSISAYREPREPGLSEDRLELEDDPDDLNADIAVAYGPLKAASERAGWAHFGERSTMVRPTFVVGAFDATLRFPYWVERVRRGGVIAVPGPGNSYLQWIDARDLANFVVHLVEAGRSGAFHTTGPMVGQRFVETIEQIAAQIAPPGTVLEVVSAEKIKEAKLRRRFPLWSPETENVMALDSSLALSEGLSLRPLGDTVDDVVEWWADRAWPEHWLSAEKEADLLAL